MALTDEQKRRIRQAAADRNALHRQGAFYTEADLAAKARDEESRTRTVNAAAPEVPADVAGETKQAVHDYSQPDPATDVAAERERNREALRKAQETLFAAGASSADLPAWLTAPKRPEDSQRAAREAAEAHRKSQMQAAADDAVAQADMAEYESWTEEDRANLDRYILERDQKYYNSITPGTSDAFVTARDLEVNPVVEKYGQQRADEMAETLTRRRNRELTEQLTRDAGESAGKNWLTAAGHSLLSVPANVLGGVSGIAGLVREGQQRTGRYSALDANNEGNLLNAYAGAVRGEVAGNIAGDEYAETGERTREGGTVRQLLSYGYQGIMSLADSISRGLAFGAAGGAALAASGSFTQTVSDASRRGATPQQAVALGVATAGMEYISEKIPMDEVFKLAKGGKTNALVQAFKQAGIEITTEELSLFGSMVAEAAILREKSAYRQQIGDLVAHGASYEEAKKQADRAFWEEFMQTAFVSGISGGFSGGGAAIAGNLAANNAPEVTEALQPMPPVQASPGAPAVDEGQQTIDAVAAEPAQETPPAVEGLLEGLRDMTPAPEPLTGERQQLNAAVSATLEEVLGKMNSAESGATNTMANAVLSDPDALERLVRQTGTEITGTKAEQRRAVKNALNSLFSDSSGMAAEPADNMEAGGPATERQAIPNAAAIANGMEPSQQMAEQPTAPDEVAVPKEHIRMEDYTNNNSPVWRNVEYTDDATKANITQQTHQQMVESGAVVKVSDEVIQAAEQSFPDLREMKKKDRTPILKDSISRLKSNLRQFLGKLSGQSFEFEVNGKILEAKLYSTGINEVLEKVNKDKASMLYSTDQIFRNAQYLYSTPDYDGDPNVYRWNYFYTPVQIGNDTVGVRIAVRDMVTPQESQIYNWGIKKDAPLGDVGHTPNGRTSYGASSDASINTIPDSIPKVNGSSRSTQQADTETGVQIGASKYPGESAEGGQQKQQAVEPVGQQHLTEQSPGIKGTGAAEANFTGLQEYESLISDDNIQRTRATDTRQEEILKTDPQGRTVSEFAGNVGNSGAISDRDVDTLKQLVQDGALGHDTQRMGDVHRTARERIRTRGASTVKNDITRAVATGRINEHLIAEAEILFAHYSNQERSTSQEAAAELLVDLAQMATQSGRQLNMFKLMRQLTPEGQLMTVIKNVQRTVDRIDTARNRRQQADPQIPDELERKYTDAARDTLSREAAVEAAVANAIGEGLEEDTQKAAENALSVIQFGGLPGKAESREQGMDIKGGDLRAAPPEATELDIPWGEVGAQPARDADIQTNDMNERVGRRVADSLTRQARQQDRSVEDILYSEIMRFANDKAAAGRTREGSPSQTPNLEAMRDYYRYRPFFQNAWDIARDRVEQAMFSMQDGDPRIPVIEQFLASGDELLGVENWNPIGAMDYANPQSTLRKGAKEAAGAAGIRMDNRVDQTREQVTRQLRDVLTENAAAREEAARQIARVAVESMGLDGAAAEAMAADVTSAFYNDLAQRSARRVAQLFGADRNTRQNVEKTMTQRLGELYNMGAFSDGDYRQAAFDSIFGEGSGITVDERLMETFVNAAGERRDRAADEIYKHVAAQIPATMQEKWDNWRYMAMLGNVKTNLRNIAGNAVMRPYSALKRTIGAAVESCLLEQRNRTKAILGPGKDSRDLLRWAKEDGRTKQAREAMRYSGTTGDTADQKIDEYRRIYNNRGLEAARKGIQGAMEAEDMAFKRREYAVSLASFLKARGFTAQQAASGEISGEILAEARSYAVNEAMKATFSDRNRFSDAAVNLRAKGGGFGSAVINTVGEGLLPFRRTPANIVARAVEYSPAGIVKACADYGGKVRTGEMSAAQCIDTLAAGAVGSVGWALGALLASGAVPGIRLVGEEDDENELDRGVQPYSLIVGDRSYGIEWLAPANIPLFIGANLYGKLTNLPEGGDFWDILGCFGAATVSALNPLLELSCLSSLNDAAETMAYEETPGDKALALICSGATNYFLQAFPTLAGQIDQAADETKKSVYSDADNTIRRSVEKGIGRAFQKLPGDPFQIEKIGSDGEPVRIGETYAQRLAQATMNPMSVTEIQTTPVTQEISRLNEVLAQDVTAPKVPQSVSYKDTEGNVHKDLRLTGDQYVTMQKVQRQTRAGLLDALIRDPVYQAMTDEQKGEVFGCVDDYAREQAKAAALPGYSSQGEKWMARIQDGKEAEQILAHVAESSLSGAVSGLSDAWENGNSQGAAESGQNLQWAYDTFRSLSRQEQDRILDSGGVTAKYIEARQAGVPHGDFLKAAEHINAVEGTGSYSKQTGRNTVLSVDVTQAIVTTPELTDVVRDRIVKCYMTDYDPDAKSPDYTELKYDYVRQALRLSPAGYAETYRAYSDNSKKADQIAAIAALGYDRDMAQKLYDVYASTKKGKRAYMEHYEANQ